MRVCSHCPRPHAMTFVCISSFSGHEGVPITLPFDGWGQWGPGKWNTPPWPQHCDGKVGSWTPEPTLLTATLWKRSKLLECANKMFIASGHLALPLARKGNGMSSVNGIWWGSDRKTLDTCSNVERTTERHSLEAPQASACVISLSPLYPTNPTHVLYTQFQPLAYFLSTRGLHASWRPGFGAGQGNYCWLSHTVPFLF